MILVMSNKARRLIEARYIGRVRRDEFAAAQEDFNIQLKELPAGFTLLTDFSQLESMDFDCATDMGRMMEKVSQAGVALVVRVIPDPQKDIGMNILTAFHYEPRPRIVTCATLREAAQVMEAQS